MTHPCHGLQHSTWSERVGALIHETIYTAACQAELTPVNSFLSFRYDHFCIFSFKFHFSHLLWLGFLSRIFLHGLAINKYNSPLLCFPLSVFNQYVLSLFSCLWGSVHQDPSHHLFLPHKEVPEKLVQRQCGRGSPCLISAHFFSCPCCLFVWVRSGQLRYSGKQPPCVISVSPKA